MFKSDSQSTTLSDLIRRGFFEAVYAKSNPNSCENSPRRGSVEAAEVKARDCACPPPAPPCSSGNRGKTGAGVSGSRNQPQGDRDPGGLPTGATNPGLLRYIHNAARYRIPQCFEGASLSVKQDTKENWMLGHSMAFSSVSPGGYKLLLSYMDKSKPSKLPYFVMEAAPGGQMSCEVRVGPSDNTRATVVAQIADREIYSFESIFDAYFNNCTASVIAVNRDFIALHYLQAITDKISLGAEFVSRVQATELSSASAAARFMTTEHSASVTLGSRGLDLCYARAIAPHLTVAGMLEVGFAIRRAVATLAYEWRADEWTVRGSADSDGLVGATLQRGLGGKQAKLACEISALLNHPNNKFRLGFGVTAAVV
ncbi:mitochondrial import receptor subunit TOM40 homolog [Cydia pomonella]|uniref:mitochondrial import receptor subunit TOM40 homolog n=1 Tax=Cydia pomonella TaxID=82600 RepID=UPI002ADDD4AA|nr:mitochondrial import receptor subunit TOM40 homolog [Cydia pomonella]